MSTITTNDGTEIYYKDWGEGPAVTFSHGWPLNADAWDAQLLFLVQNGYRVVAHDRRGHGRSGQPSNGNDMNGYADDLAAVIEALDLHDATLVGHSTGGGEVARYIGRHGTSRVSKALLLSAVPPIMVQSDTNPEGLPMKVFDDLRAGVMADRSQFYKDLALPFYGANLPGANVSLGALDQILAVEHASWHQGFLRKHQGLLRDRFHRGPQEVRRSHPCRARGGRPDRPCEGFGAEVGEAHPRCAGDLLPGGPARPHSDARGQVQRRPVGLPPELAVTGTWEGNPYRSSAGQRLSRPHRLADEVGSSLPETGARPKSLGQPVFRWWVTFIHL